jgi:TP53 regulating kinase-like protein
LVLEFVEGRTVRRVLDAWAEGAHHQREKKGDEKDEAGGDEEMLDLMRRVGSEVGKLHDIGVCHGDLTTSNLMLCTPDEKMRDEESEGGGPRGRQTTSSLREAAMNGTSPPSPPPLEPTQPQLQADSLRGTIYLIDFGLTTASIQDEDKAVDLYVLERAFAATHPAAEPLFQEVLRAYGESYKGAKGVLRRLEGVRLRGRKRSMLG